METSNGEQAVRSFIPFQGSLEYNPPKKLANNKSLAFLPFVMHCQLVFATSSSTSTLFSTNLRPGLSTILAYMPDGRLSTRSRRYLTDRLLLDMISNFGRLDQNPR